MLEKTEIKNSSILFNKYVKYFYFRQNTIWIINESV